MPNNQLLVIPSIEPVMDGFVTVRINNWSTKPQQIYSFRFCIL